MFSINIPLLFVCPQVPGGVRGLPPGGRCGRDRLVGLGHQVIQRLPQEKTRGKLAAHSHTKCSRLEEEVFKLCLFYEMKMSSSISCWL